MPSAIVVKVAAEVEPVAIDIAKDYWTRKQIHQQTVRAFLRNCQHSVSL